ncbi:MAG: hypothetical protein R2698_09915 [Microthrixaceae bacterium]
MLWCGGLAIGAGPLSDNSFLTHLATGRLILEHGAPHRNVLSWGSYGAPVVVQSWLASWVYAVLERGVGAGSIRLLVACCIATLMVLLWRLSGPRRDRGAARARRGRGRRRHPVVE